MHRRVSLAELIDADVPLRPDEAVSIMREVCRQYAAGDLRGIPNATVIRLTPDGRILVEGPMNRDLAPVPAAAALLTELLPGFDSPNGFRVPGGLRLVLARATRSIDLPPFAGVEEFCAALERFAAPDLGDTVRGLFNAWAAREASHPRPAAARELTISDIRRARRATGLSLEDVAQAAGIPAAKLRELEWGYLVQWPADETGREDLRRYARAAGLDEDLVVSVAWPMIEVAALDPLPLPPSTDGQTWALVPAAPQTVMPLPVVAAPPSRKGMSGWRWAVAVVAAVVLLAGVAIESVRPATVAAEAPPPPPAQTEARAPDPRPVAAPDDGAVEEVRPATLVRPATPRPRAQKAKARQTPAPHRSFFKRELFRIVFK
jgi:hypothetical protein